MDYLYQSFKGTILKNLGAKYKYLPLNNPFKISQLSQQGQNQNIPVYEEPIEFAQAWPDVIRDMLVKFQNETGFILINSNDWTFTLTNSGITELKKLYPIDPLYENFKTHILDGLGEKYRHLRFNTTIYQNYPFKISQIRQEKNPKIPVYEAGFGFTGPDEKPIRDMLIDFQNETGFILINSNDSTFSLTDKGITKLKKLDASLSYAP
jgi:hypothetical protein